MKNPKACANCENLDRRDFVRMGGTAVAATASSVLFDWRFCAVQHRHLQVPLKRRSVSFMRLCPINRRKQSASPFITRIVSGSVRTGTLQNH